MTTEHMLLGLLDQNAATAAQVLKTLGVDDAAYEELKQLVRGFSQFTFARLLHSLLMA